MADDDAPAGPNIFSKFVASIGGKKKLASKGMLTNQLANKLDIDLFGRQFGKFAGSDEVMDQQEFEGFSKQMNLTRQQAMSLWLILDKDNSGEVSKDEFNDVFKSFQNARAWLRYCPDCIYSNTCAYCMETNSNCQNCTENAYCAACWADHPARHREVDDGEGAGHKAALSTSDMLRTNLVVRPLNWAYTSPMMAWLPVPQKAALRQALRQQQQVLAESQEKARQEEQAALAMRR